MAHDEHDEGEDREARESDREAQLSPNERDERRRMKADKKEREEREERDESGVELSDELARRWDPQRLSKLVASKAGKAEGLDILTRQRYEKRFGVDLSRVKVVTGPFAQEFTTKHGAEAITVGASGMILMRESSHFAGMAQRESLLAHELTHVAQSQPGFHNRDTAGSPNSAAGEAEAEAHEQAVHDEASGEGAPADADGSGATGEMPDPNEGSNEELRRERLTHLVLDLIAEEQRIQSFRGGHSS